MLRLIVKVGSTILGDGRDAIRFKDGDIISAYSDAMVKKIWDSVLANGRIDQATYDSKIISPGVMEMPHGSEDIKQHLVVVIDDTFTEAQIKTYKQADIEETGDTDPSGAPIYAMVRRRRFKIDIDNMKYFSNTTQTWVKFSPDSLNKIRDPSVIVPVRYDKPLQKTELIQKADP